jgi:hypothetical protein
MLPETLPSAPDVERAVLGAFMLEREAYYMVEDQLTGDLFYRPDHNAIYKAIMDLYSSDRAVDPLMVCEMLRDRDILDNCGGEATIDGIAQEIGSAANVRYHVQVLREKALLRRLMYMNVQSPLKKRMTFPQSSFFHENNQIGHLPKLLRIKHSEHAGVLAGILDLKSVLTLWWYEFHIFRF